MQTVPSGCYRAGYERDRFFPGKDPFSIVPINHIALLA